MKKLISILLALVLLLSCMPFQLLSFAETVDTGKELFNIFDANSYYWKKASWSSNNSLSNGQLKLENGIFLYTGYDLGAEKISYVVNHNTATSGYYDIYLRSDIDYSSATAGQANIQSGSPILVRYSIKDKEFLLFQGAYGSNDYFAKLWVDLVDDKDHTVEIITTENADANTTTLQLVVDGRVLNAYNGSCTFAGIKGKGNIAFIKYNAPVTIFKDFNIEGVTFDPYYTDSVVADFENCDGLTLNSSTGATVSLSSVAAHSGSTSIFLNDISSGTVGFALESAADAKALRKNVTYRVTAWVKSVSGGQISIYPKTADSRNTVSGAKGNIYKQFTWWGLGNNWATMMDKTENDDWRKVLITSEFTISSGYEFPAISIWATGSNAAAGSGWYIDDVAFEAVLDNEPVVSENDEYGTVSYTNYVKLNSAAATPDVVGVCLGDTVNAVATANAGYYFSGWYKGEECVSKAANYSYVTDGATLTAKFNKFDSSRIYQSWEQQGVDGFAYKVTDNNAGAIITDTVAHTGNYSVKVATNGTQSNYLFSCSDNTTSALEVGRKYQAFVWVKPSDLGRMNIQLCGVANLNSNANTTNFAAFNTVNKSKIVNAAIDSTDDGWYKVCIGQFTAVQDRPYVSIYCWVDRSISADFEWYYDDLELIAVDDNLSIQDFENTPSNFSINAGNATVEVTDVEAISGNESLMIKTGESSSNVFTALFDSSTAPLEVGADYRVTMWMKIKQASSNFNLKLTSVNTYNDYNATAVSTSFADLQITESSLKTYYVNKANAKSYGVDSSTATDWYNACFCDNYTADGKYVKLYVWMPANCEVYIDNIVFTKVHTVKTTVEGSGQVSASNGFTYEQLNSTGATISSSVRGNEVVHLTALPDSGYSFAGWKLNDEIVSTSPDFDVLPKENVTYTAVFTGETPVYDEITSDSIAATLTTGDVSTVTNKQFIDESLLSMGNSDRMALAIKKAINGEDITIGFIGGSITEGAGADNKTNSWAYLVYNWFVETFPNSNINYVNSAIAGSYSRLGVTYVDSGLLVEEPDIVFLDYSVNDYNGSFKDSYETIVRKILSAKNKPALAMIDFTRESVDDWSYYNEQAIYDALGVYYGLPIINIHKAITPFFESGLLLWDDYSSDAIHPNNVGHAMVASAVINYLNKAKAYAQESETLVTYEIKEGWYFGKSDLDNAFMSYADEISAETDGFTKNGKVSRFGWKAFNSTTKGSSLTFNLKDCTEAIVVYGQSGSVVPSDMEIYVNDELYATVSPVKDSTPWCVANITSIVPMDMEIKIVTLEDAICNIAGVYANVGTELKDEVVTLRKSLAELDEMDLDTANEEISAVKAVVAKASKDASSYIVGANERIALAESTVNELESLVSVNTFDITSLSAQDDILTVTSGVEVKQWNVISSAGFTTDAYGIAIIPTSMLSGELKKASDDVLVYAHTSPVKRAIYKTYVKGINTEIRKSTELTARSYTTYSRDGFAINVYDDTFTVVYNSLIQ